MKNLLLLSILLIVGCEEVTEPEPEDCAGVPGGDAVEDECGVCGGDGADEGYDCDGNCTAPTDCAGECGGSAVEDECGVCGGDGSTCIVCADCSDSECCDCDGNIYETVQIGDQLWMAENLKVTHYNDGSEIQYVQQESSEPDVWQNLSTGAYGYYNDDPTNLNTYGNLYNWYTVDDSRGVCPDGWHVPSDEEFMELEMFLGMSEEEANIIGFRGSPVGSKLAGSSDLWWDDDILVNNSEFGTSGFNFLPAGYRSASDGAYDGMGNFGDFWSSSEYGSDTAWGRGLNYDYSGVGRYDGGKQYGVSVRCLGD